MTERFIFTPENLTWGNYQTEEAKIDACKRLNEASANHKPYVPKVWTIEDIADEYSREDAAIVVAHLNEHGSFCAGVTNVDNPHPALVRFFLDEYKGYYYDDDQNHSGCLYVTEDAFELYDIQKEAFEELTLWHEQEDIDEINEGRDKPLTHYFYIGQYWSVFGPDCKIIDEDDWDSLPEHLQPYEEEFVLGINGLPQDLIDDDVNCWVGGWCDG